MCEGWGGTDHRSDYERERDDAAFTAQRETRELRERVAELERKRDKRERKSK